MLVLSRHRDESIVIGDDVVVTVVDIRGDKVRLGISAPIEVPVHRNEVYDAIRRKESAQAPAPPDCPACRSALDIHQPVADDPYRLLGTCFGCGAWYAFRVTPGGAYTRATVPGLAG